MFRIDPERGYEIFKNFARFPLPNLCKETKLSLKLNKIKLNNPVGLAAGFDKNAEMVSFLGSLGFGYLVVGSVLWNESKGNPKPRLIRYEKFNSIVNSMGLPTVGIKKFLQNLSKHRVRVPIFVSIAGNSIEEILGLYRILKNYVNVVEINLSCPNTENGRLFQDAYNFRSLAREIEKLKSGIIFVKVSPAVSINEKENLQELIDICLKYKIDGITAVNALPVIDKAISVGFGGLSGKLIFKYMLRTVKFIRDNSNGKLIINACGGIFSGEDAIKAILNGASTVQLYTALIYQGPSIVCEIKKKIEEFLLKNNFKGINEMIGYSENVKIEY